jgi:hypothetical protein
MADLKITSFMCALVRGIVETGNGKLYFDRLEGWPMHRQDCIEAGLLDEKGALTPLGRRIGAACSDLPKGPSWAIGDAYRSRAKAALEEPPATRRDKAANRKPAAKKGNTP